MSAPTPEELVTELQSPKKFNVRDAINKVTYPEDDVRVYVNAGLAYAAQEKAQEAAQMRTIAEGYSAEALQGIADAPEKEEYDARAEALEAESEALIAECIKSALTFHLRGIAPEVYRTAVRAWQRKIKDPIRGSYQGEDAEERYQSDAFDKTTERNGKFHEDLVAHAIVRVTNAAGEVDDSGWTQEDVANLRGSLYSSEYNKLDEMVQVLTFSNALFDSVIAQDADFLPKP